MPNHLSLPFSGEKLRGTRERLGLTRPDLARKCAAAGHPVSVQHICRVENGPHLPSAPLLKALADALDVAVDDLLDQTKAGAA
jgi:transcriptional regulator with XRE-family HTH domain